MPPRGDQGDHYLMVPFAPCCPACLRRLVVPYAPLGHGRSRYHGPLYPIGARGPVGADRAADARPRLCCCCCEGTTRGDHEPSGRPAGQVRLALPTRCAGIPREGMLDTVRGMVSGAGQAGERIPGGVYPLDSRRRVFENAAPRKIVIFLHKFFAFKNLERPPSLAVSAAAVSSRAKGAAHEGRNR